ncbi:acyltransferase, WS/DGAT/MGAT [Ferrimonas sediminum]|uniref:diacylglycerol O-acyltransferase n=1 Tax=Ferrimonas sediminum TaxID=718193 RepID=A0A1G8W272_9GAMM|nr:wax ester/triacylglycerol synthase domain-containing protein [Ferrimonas sediminum]SDJ72494.1 acyltransferase, WS/DGAT/MGAT [Ferrimonas sediminum]
MASLSLSELVFLLFESDSTPLHVSGLMLFRPPVDQPDFATTLHQQMVHAGPVAPPFDRVITSNRFGLPKWRNAEEVELGYHVRLSKLPKPGDNDQLLELAARIHSYCLDRSRPLWELWIIDGLASGEVAIVVKFHHALTDGMRAVQLLERSFAVSEQRGHLVPFWQLGDTISDDNEEEFSSVMSVLQPSFWRRQLKVGFDSARLLAMASAGRLNLIDTPIKLPFSAPRTPFNHLAPGRAKQVTLASLSDARVNRLALLTGAQSDDVILTLCDMSLHRYLQQHNWQESDPLVAMVPLRDHDTGARLHMISVGLVELGGAWIDPLERLAQIQRTHQGIRRQTNRTSLKAYNRYSAVINVLSLMVARFDDQQYLPPAANMLITEVDASHTSLTFQGAELVATYPLSLLMPGQTLNMTLLRYGGQLHFGLVCCRHSLPGFEAFGDYLEQSLDELEATVIGNLSRRLNSLAS